MASTTSPTNLEAVFAAMEVKLPAGWFYAVLIIAVTVWILHSVVHALLAAWVTAMAG